MSSPSSAIAEHSKVKSGNQEWDDVHFFGRVEGYPETSSAGNPFYFSLRHFGLLCMIAVCTFLSTKCRLQDEVGAKPPPVERVFGPLRASEEVVRSIKPQVDTAAMFSKAIQRHMLKLRRSECFERCPT